MEWFVFVALGGATLYLAGYAIGVYRWRIDTGLLVRRLSKASVASETRVIRFAELASLPLPVQRYFRAVLTEGKATVVAARLAHTGSFNASATGARWQPFSSRQWVTINRPGFVWDARIAFAPGLPLHVHHAYLAGEGLLHVALMGLVRVADMRGTADIARGELMRYLAEAPLVPTALLPSQGVQWSEVDASSADATLSDGTSSVTLRFRFNEQDTVETVSAASRGRSVGGEVVPTPWQGRWWRYERRDGMLVPTEGEVAWSLPGGALPYWRGRLQQIAYDFAKSD